MPDERVAAAALRLQRELADVRAVLTDRVSASIRLVLTPESVVVAESRRLLTALRLHGYSVDAVLANRVFPAGGDDWRAGWAAAQASQLEAVRESFAPLPGLVSPYLPEEPVGLAPLAALAASAYGDGPLADPLAPPPADADPVRVERSTDGFILSVALPAARRGEVSLARSGDELVVGYGSTRRVLTLPSALRRCEVSDAALRDGRLRIAFGPDPALWMGQP